MNYFRIFGALLVFLSCAMLGIYQSYRLKLRPELLKAFVSFMSALETNIRYHCGDIAQLIRASAPEMIAELSNGFGKTPGEYFNAFISNIPKAYSLKPDEINAVKEFGEKLGTTDTEGEIDRVRFYKKIFEESYNNSLEEYKVKSRLYKSLGIAAGAALALLIV